MERIHSRWDVIVAGGGPTGIAATIAAARAGARTLLIEKSGFLTGEGATGIPFLTFHAMDGTQVIRGIAQDIVDRLIQAGGCMGHVHGSDAHHRTMTPIYPEIFKYVAQEMILEAGGHLLLHSQVVETLLDGRRIRGVVAQTKSEREIFPARVVVDATGDGDVSFYAGAPYAKGRDQDGLCQAMTLMFTLGNVDVERAGRVFPRCWFYATRPWEHAPSLVHIAGDLGPWDEIILQEKIFDVARHKFWAMILWDGILTINVSNITGCDGTSSEGLTAAEITARRQVMALTELLRARVPGFERAYLLSTGARIGLRETRRILGDYTLTRDDVLEGRSFPDAVARASYCIDMHGPANEGTEFTPLRQAGVYDIPYRALLPQELEGLLAAGRCFSATHEALGSARVMAICMAMGHAAGLAAAMAAERSVSPRAIDVEELRGKLRAEKAIV
jgi:hypothetical protein